MDLADLPIEYVTAALRLTAFDAWEGGEVQIWISLVNAGTADGVTRAFGFRRSNTQSYEGSDAGVQVFDSDVDAPRMPPTDQALSGVVRGGEHWLFPWIVDRAATTTGSRSPPRPRVSCPASSL